MTGIPIRFENRILFFTDMAFEPTRCDDLFNGLHIIALAFQFLVDFGLVSVSVANIVFDAFNAFDGCPELKASHVDHADALTDRERLGEATGNRASTGTPVSAAMAIARGKEGVTLPALILVIIERSHPTFEARYASVLPMSSRYFASAVMRIM
nr:hypothetical protein [Ochrobactrum sp. 3-3]